MEDFIGRTIEFVAPTGNTYKIREQNGEDDDIISNPIAAKELSNLAEFISGIVVDSTLGRLTAEDVMNLPRLDKYLILFKSRQFSLGNDIDFEYNWGDRKVGYTQDISEYIFDDYSNNPTDDELKSKPYAIPYYPQGNKSKDFEITVGEKIIRYDLLTGNGEKYLIKLPPEEKTKNKNLIARNIRLLVNGNWERITSFRGFSIKEMTQIRNEVYANDPDFNGTLEVQSPETGEIAYTNIIGLPSFFYPGEVV